MPGIENNGQAHTYKISFELQREEQYAGRYKFIRFSIHDEINIRNCGSVYRRTDNCLTNVLFDVASN